MSIHDMARTALGDDPRADYNPSNPDLSNYHQRLNAARAIHAAAYPPLKVTELAAVSVTVTSTTAGTVITTNDNRHDTED
jgi:hypothetical protein